MSKQGDGFRMMRVVGVERIAPHMQRLRVGIFGKATGVADG